MTTKNSGTHAMLLVHQAISFNTLRIMNGVDDRKAEKRISEFG
jgi:hypothetical protein